MSALRLVITLCVGCVALRAAGSSKVTWGDFRGAATIQCQRNWIRVDESDSVDKGVTGRLQNVDVNNKDLMPDDIGLYWCMYKTADAKPASVLLVVKESGKAVSNDNVIFLSVMISTTVILSIMMAALMWLIKIKTRYTGVKPQPDQINVYEIMTGRRTENVCLPVSPHEAPLAGGIL